MVKNRQPFLIHSSFDTFLIVIILFTVGIEDMFEQLDLTEDTEESCPEKNDLSPEEEIKTTPVNKWLPSEVPLCPQDDFVQIRVTHVDNYGQIVSFSSHC